MTHTDPITNTAREGESHTFSDTHPNTHTRSSELSLSLLFPTVVLTTSPIHSIISKSLGGGGGERHEISPGVGKKSKPKTRSRVVSWTQEKLLLARNNGWSWEYIMAVVWQAECQPTKCEQRKKNNAKDTSIKQARNEHNVRESSPNSPRARVCVCVCVCWWSGERSNEVQNA